MSTFRAAIPIESGPDLTLSLGPGSSLVILGPNGTGKSALLSYLFRLAGARAVPLMAYRASRFDSGGLRPQMMGGSVPLPGNADIRTQGVDLAGPAKLVAFKALWDKDRAELDRLGRLARERDLTQLSDEEAAEYRRARVSKTEFDRLNGVLEAGFLAIPIEANESSTDPEIYVRRGEDTYPISQASDGERDAATIAAEVLAAKPDAVLILDEPERHLHPAISAPLLAALRAERPDCVFVISTHDTALARSVGSELILTRGVNLKAARREPSSDVPSPAWTLDRVSDLDDMDEDLVRALLGGRRKILFVEGTGTSLDAALYGYLFPGVSVKAYSGADQVQAAVTTFHNNAQLTAIRAFGIIDRDGRSHENISKMAGRGLYALACHSVESLYYSRPVRTAVAESRATALQRDPAALLATADREALEEFGKAEVREKLVSRLAEQHIHNALKYAMPKGGEVATAQDCVVSVSSRSLMRLLGTMNCCACQIWTGCSRDIGSEAMVKFGNEWLWRWVIQSILHMRKTCGA